MNCPYCGSLNIKVVDSRESREGNLTRRRRECLNCGKRFSTIESIVKLDLQVRKSSGRVEDFDLEKVKKGIMKACDKRSVTLEDVDRLVEKITEDLREINESVIESNYIGDIVMKRLRNFDEIAYLKFSIVYKRYSSVQEFVEDMKREFKLE